MSKKIEYADKYVRIFWSQMDAIVYLSTNNFNIAIKFFRNHAVILVITQDCAPFLANMYKTFLRNILLYLLMISQVAK